MTLRLEIDCFCHYKNEYKCKPIPGTKVTSQQVAYNLIRCNPGLARYFSNTMIIDQKILQVKEIKKDCTLNEPYISITQQKSLNFLPTYKYSLEKQQNFKIKSSKKDNFVSIQVQTLQNNEQNNIANKIEQKNLQKNIRKKLHESIESHDINFQKENHRKILSQGQRQKQKFFKDHKQQSRYLPDTTFKNYYNRPVFFNYGCQNVHGNYNENYLKSYNINPHIDPNHPEDLETYNNALIRTDKSKLSKSNKNVKQFIENTKDFEKLHDLKKSLSREKDNSQSPDKKMDLVIIDNVLYHENMKKYKKPIVKNSNTNISSKRSYNANVKSTASIKKIIKEAVKEYVKPNFINNGKIINQINSKNIKAQNSLQDKLRENPIDLRIKSPRAYKKIDKIDVDNINQLSEIKNNPKTQYNAQAKIQDECIVDKINKSGNKDILSKKCNIKCNKNNNKNIEKQPNNISNVPSPVSRKSNISHEQFCGKQCQCCYDKIKEKLRRKSQQDPDFENRLITSAKRVTLYKNYALNNQQNAELNPHNYRNCCGDINKS